MSWCLQTNKSWIQEAHRDFKIGTENHPMLAWPQFTLPPYQPMTNFYPIHSFYNRYSQHQYFCWKCWHFAYTFRNYIFFTHLYIGINTHSTAIPCQCAAEDVTIIARGQMWVTRHCCCSGNTEEFFFTSVLH